MKHLAIGFMVMVIQGLVVSSPALAADLVAAPSLTLEGAHRAVAAAAAYARAHDAPGGAIAVVDAGGQTIVVERLDGSFPAGADISVGKARTAVMFRRPTRGLEEIINKGRAAMIPVAAVTAFTPLQGGIPITIDGRIVGGIGVSGAASAQQDEEIALAGAQAFDQPAPAAAVQHIAAHELMAAFAAGESGGTVIERPEFRVNASRRDGAGEAEVHMLDTDIFYVLEGRATLVTGGEVLEPRSLSATEQRGSSLRAGTSQQLAAGDVVTIPRGVPHWFKTVTTPFHYLVIKSAAGAGR